MDDYATVLYQDQWLNASPLKPALGSLTNYTLDSFFGGERLVRPYTLHKAAEKECDLIDISDDDAKRIAGLTVKELQEADRLFAVDRSCPCVLDSLSANSLQTATRQTKRPMCRRSSTTSTELPFQLSSTSTRRVTCCRSVSAPMSAQTSRTRPSTRRMTGFSRRSCST